jgi:hypothetical protein
MSKEQNHPAGAVMPELPTYTGQLTWERNGQINYNAGEGYTADQMRAYATEAVEQSLAQEAQEDASCLQNWLTIIHDNDLSIGDRLQRLSSQMNLILGGKSAAKYPPHTSPRSESKTSLKKKCFRR